MKRLFLQRRFGICALAAMLLVSPARAAITVVDYYRLGDADASAANGATVNTPAPDSVGSKPLTRVGSPTYTNGISLAAAQHTGSQLAVNFSGSTQGLSNGVLITNTDNFGIETWVRPGTISGNHSIAYNGNTGTSGWGLYELGANYQGLFGGVTTVGSTPATLNGWTHLALVRASGTTTLYVNGAAVGTAPNTPNLPAGGFCIAMPGQGGATENFNGQIDEVRVFTFTAGQFSTNDLLLNVAPVSYPVTMTAALQTDVNGNGRVNPGDTLRYTVVITNNTAGTLSNTVFNAPGISNAALVNGSVKAAPIARSDAPIANSAPGNAFHGAFNSTLSVTAVSGLLSNDFVGAPAATITSFGGGSFGATVTAHPAGTTANTAGVGALTVNADGSLTFVPANGFTGPTTFQYRLANSVGTSDASATIAIGNRPAANTDSYNVTGNTLLDTSLIPQTVLANDTGDNIGIFTSTFATHGSANLSANGNFTYNPGPGYIGADSFTYTITNGFGPVIGTVNLNVSNRIWYIDNASFAVEEGRSSTPFRLLATFNAQNNGAAGHSADNDFIFIRQGNSNYASGIVLRTGQTLIGDGSSGTLANAFGFAFAPGSARAPGVPITSFTGTDPMIVNSSVNGNGISLLTNNTIRGLTVSDTPNGNGYVGTNVGNLTLSESSKIGLGGAISVSGGGVLAVTFDTLTSSNAPGAAINLVNCNGALTATAGRIDSPNGAALGIVGGSANITYPGNITKNSVGPVMSISSKIGGVVSFGGAISQNSSGGTGISLTSNPGATINFTGPITLNTSVNPAFTATGGGTITATASGSTLTTTTGTALNVANTTIGAGGLTFQSISSGTAASGPVNGIVLNNTGAGAFTIAGTGSAGSGGTIQKTTGSGISLTSVGGSVSLTDVNISNTAGDGITAATVKNFSCSLCNIINPGSSASKDGLRLTELSGAASLMNVTVTGATQDSCYLQNSSAALTSLTVTGGSFGANNNAFATAGSGMEVLAVGTGVITSATISGTTFANNFSSGLQSFAQDTATIGDIIVSNCTFTKNGSAAADFDAGTGSNPQMKFHFLNNLTIVSNVGPVINVFSSSTATGGLIQGRIAGNHIGTTGVTDSGSTGGEGIRVFLQGVPGNITIVSNIIRATACSRGIGVTTLGPQSGGGANRTSDIVIIGNDVDNFSSDCSFPLNDIYLTADDQAGTTTTLRAEVHGNKIKAASATPANTDFPFDSAEWLYFDRTDSSSANPPHPNSTAQLVDFSGPHANANAAIAATQTSGAAKANAAVTLIAGPINTVP